MERLDIWVIVAVMLLGAVFDLLPLWALGVALLFLIGYTVLRISLKNKSR